MDSGAATGVTLLLGPPNSGKRGVVLEWWRERLPRWPVVVMPTAPDAQDMTAEMARRAQGLVGQSPAVTFAGLAELVLGRQCRFVDDFERNLLVCGLLQRTPLEALGGVKRLPGMLDVTATLLLELGGSGKTAEEIEATLGRWASAEPESAGIARDIGRLFAGYRRESGRLGWMDQPAAVSEATRLADGWQRPVAFWGFASFSRGQRALMEELSRRTEILVVLTHDLERGVGLCAPEEAEWWSERASTVVNVQARERAYASSAIAHLERSLLDESLPRASSAGGEEADGVHFLLASGRRAEAELTAEQIAELIRKGADPGDIAVVVRHVQNWVGLLGDVFTSCGIPWQADARLRLVDTGLGHAFLCALRGVASDDPESTFSFLRSPYSGVDLEEVGGLETRYRRGRERGTRALAALAERDGQEALRQLWALADTTGREPEAGSGPVLDPSAALALAEDMLVSGVCGTDVGSRELEDDARAFRTLQSALGRAADITGRDGVGLNGRSAAEADASLRLSDCLRLQTALDLLTRIGVSGPARSAPGTVQILSARRARARRFQVVFILGLVEGEFPGVSEGASLLSASQRSSLEQADDGLFAPAEEGERTLFIDAVSRAWRSLYLSARDAEDDGGEAVPSRFWQEAKVVLEVGEESHRRRTLAEQVFSPETAPTPRHYVRACADAKMTPSQGRYGEGIPAAPGWSRVPLRLSSPGVLAELEGMEHFSPSALEAYVRCPFAWFIERVIRAEEVEPGLDGRMIGELIHRVLSECYRSLASEGRLPLTAEGLEEAEDVAEGIIDRLLRSPDCPGSPADRRVARWRLQSMARRMLRMEAASDGQLHFAEAERDVGGAEGADIGGIRVRGRVDRMDRTPDTRGVFVFDYKSGGIPTASTVGTGEGLQLPLYLLALGTEAEEAEVIGGAYVSLTEGKLAGVVAAENAHLVASWPGKFLELDKEGWEQLVHRCKDIAVTAAEGIRAGVVAPRSDSPCPDWCALGPACRSRRGRRGR